MGPLAWLRPRAANPNAFQMLVHLLFDCSKLRDITPRRSVAAARADNIDFRLGAGRANRNPRMVPKLENQHFLLGNFVAFNIAIGVRFEFFA